MRLAERLAPGELVHLGTNPYLMQVVPRGWVYRMDGAHVRVLRPALVMWRAGDRWIKYYLCTPEQRPEYRFDARAPSLGPLELEGDEHL